LPVYCGDGLDDAERHGHLEVLQWAQEHGCPAEWEAEWETEDEAEVKTEADEETEEDD